MSFERIKEPDVNIIRTLPDRPTGPGTKMSAEELKAYFDQAGVTIREAFNKLLNDLEAASAAATIGFTSSDTIPKSNVQDAIEAVQGNLEDAERTLNETINNALMGQIPDRSIEARKLKQKTITGNEIADGTITAVKFAEGTTVAGWEELSIADVGLHVASSDASIVAIDTAHTYFRYSRTMGIMFFRVAVRDTRAHNNGFISVIQDFYKPSVPGVQGVSCALNGIFHDSYMRFEEFNVRFVRARMNMAAGGGVDSVFSYSVPVGMITTEAISANNYITLSGWYLCNGRGDE